MTSATLDKQKMEQSLLHFVLCLIVFFGAWLLFQIEPLAGKIITPRFGGTSNVWIICLLFFQIVVLVGYLLTFGISRLPPKAQIFTYIALFGISLFWSYVPGVEGWAFRRDAEPTSLLLSELTSRIAVPCILLSSVSGTMQVWSAMAGLPNPYRLYSVSNLGSFAALLAYPVAIEPMLSVSTTLRAWQINYIALFAAIAFAAIFAFRGLGKGAPQATTTTDPVDAAGTPEPDATPINIKQCGRWLFLSTLGSAGLLAFSSHITTDIAPVPLLWILPLAIYLITFVIAFGRSNVNKNLLMMSWVPLVVAEPICMFFSAVTASIINLILLFVLCQVLNSELADSKPPPGQLPTFYLALAAGGAFGGILVGLVAPIIFSFSGERLVVILVFTVYQFFAEAQALTRRRKIFRGVVSALMIITLIAWLIVPLPDVLYRERNFFGSVSVKREGEMRAFYHGRINHGQQFDDPAKAHINASLYGQPVTLVLAFFREFHGGKPLNVGVIGLGAGAVAVEGKKGDTFVFYELDPKVVRIANDWFTYLKVSNAANTVQVGDGRLLLEDSKENFDVLSVDAFNGDAIPVHLLTLEAMKIYLDHLQPDGCIVFNVTNLFLDVAPVVGNLAEALHLHGCMITYDTNVKYVIVSRDQKVIDDLISFTDKQQHIFPKTKAMSLPVRKDLRPWTDDYSNLFSILKVRNF